jgi:hypothetical protein
LQLVSLDKFNSNIKLFSNVKLLLLKIKNLNQFNIKIKNLENQKNIKIGIVKIKKNIKIILSKIFALKISKNTWFFNTKNKKKITNK